MLCFRRWAIPRLAVPLFWNGTFRTTPALMQMIYSSSCQPRPTSRGRCDLPHMNMRINLISRANFSSQGFRKRHQIYEWPWRCRLLRMQPLYRIYHVPILSATTDENYVLRGESTYMDCICFHDLATGRNMTSHVGDGEIFFLCAKVMDLVGNLNSD